MPTVAHFPSPLELVELVPWVCVGCEELIVVVAEAVTGLGSAVVASILNRVVSQVRNVDEPWLKRYAPKKGEALELQCAHVIVCLSQEFSLSYQQSGPFSAPLEEQAPSP
jgi:hypothetical protein